MIPVIYFNREATGKIINWNMEKMEEENEENHHSNHYQTSLHFFF